MDAETDTSTGVEYRVLAAIACVGGAVTGILVLALERRNRFVRFNAGQATVFSIAVMLVTLLLAGLPGIGWLLRLLVIVGAAAVWVAMIVHAFLGRRFRLPYLADLVDDRVA